MTWIFVVAALLLAVVLTVLVMRWKGPGRAPRAVTEGARRILFPFVGDSVSDSSLDAVLRLSRFEGATLVPAYIATVPFYLGLEAPIPAKCGQAMPLLETIEQRAARAGVPVDSRIETGRTPRHALKQLLEREEFDRLVVPAATRTSAGFSSEDIGWLLENAPGEILVLRPAQARVKRARLVRTAA
jgi:nucleotide-binding universal stress UspA family protein